MSYAQSALERLLHNLIRIGTVACIDNATQRIRVQSGDILTDWLPWPAEIGRNYRRWRPLRIGQQLVLACASGALDNACVIAMLYDHANPPPATSDTLDIIEFEDGATIAYDSAAHHMTLKGARITLDGDVTITRKLHVKDSIHSDNDTVAGAVSLKTHVHGGVVPGTSQTGTPL